MNADLSPSSRFAVIMARVQSATNDERPKEVVHQMSDKLSHGNSQLVFSNDGSQVAIDEPC